MDESSISSLVLSRDETIPKCHAPNDGSIECRGSEIPMNGGKNRAVVLGLVVLAVGAVMGLVAGNKEVREQLNQKSKKLFSHE
jgi:hypothetical protein